MTSLDNVFVPLATNLLNSFGSAATFRRVTRVYDVATRKVGGRFNDNDFRPGIGFCYPNRQG
jgi:hypothetical protein